MCTRKEATWQAAGATQQSNNSAVWHLDMKARARTHMWGVCVCESAQARACCGHPSVGPLGHGKPLCEPHPHTHTSAHIRPHPLAVHLDSLCALQYASILRWWLMTAHSTHVDMR